MEWVKQAFFGQALGNHAYAVYIYPGSAEKCFDSCFSDCHRIPVLPLGLDGGQYHYPLYFGGHAGFRIHQKFDLQLYCLHRQCADIQLLFHGTQVFSARL